MAIEFDNDVLDVTPGQAFHYEEQSARWANVKRHKEMYLLNEYCRIEERNGVFYIQFLIDGVWQYQLIEIAEGKPQSSWGYDYEKTYDEAWAMISLIKWMGGFSIIQRG